MHGMKKIAVEKTAATTLPGFQNQNGQVVIRRTGAPSTTFRGQTIYHLRCTHCGFDYGSNGTDILKRLCPSHQGGSAGEPLRDAGPTLFGPTMFG